MGWLSDTINSVSKSLSPVISAVAPLAQTFLRGGAPATAPAPAPAAQAVLITPPTTPESLIKEKGTFGLSRNVLLIGGGVLALGLVLFLFTRRK